MTYKSLLTIFLSSLGFVGALTPVVVAQERPECYIIDNSGQLTDLSDICNVSQKRSPKTNSGSSKSQRIVKPNGVNSNLFNTGLPLDNTLYILGENNQVTSDSGLIDSSYFIDNEIGIDYTAYIRRYKAPPTSLTRQTLRKEIFRPNRFDSQPDRFDSTPDALTSILRGGRELPFMFYRY
ncbi:MAG: hypothetical protein AAF383_16865 [Cyanobacteria bacterium P01_A01_bin.83]